jgi:hypothetical protein
MFFGDDFYNKKKIKINRVQNIQRRLLHKNLTSNQGIIAWIIEDHYTNMPNFNGILYPKIIYSSFLLNKATNNLNFIYEKILPNKKFPEVEIFGSAFLGS